MTENESLNINQSGNTITISESKPVFMMLCFLVYKFIYLYIFVKPYFKNSWKRYLAKGLKSARTLAALSQDGLVEKMGNIVSKNAISKYEKGEMMAGW